MIVDGLVIRHVKGLYIQTTRDAGAVHGTTKRWGMHAAGRGSEAAGRAREGRVSRAMAGWIGRSGFLFEREDRTSRFFLTLPSPGRGGKRYGNARCRRGERGRRPSPEGRSEPGDGGMDRQINFSI